MSIIGVGIDLGVTAQHEACILGPNKTKTFRFYTTVEEVGRLVALAEAMKTEHNDKIVFILEPTGRGWITVSRLLMEKGYGVYKANPKKVKDYRNYLNGRRKTDRLDAKVLAAMGRDHHEFDPVVLPSEDIAALQTLTRERVRLQEMAANEKKRVKSLCHYLIPGLTGALGSNLYKPQWRVFLRKFINPFEIAKAGRVGLHASLAAASCKPSDHEKIAAIYPLAQHACMSLRLGADDLEALELTLNSYFDMMEVFEKKVVELERLIAIQYAKAHKSRFLETIPGVGKTLAPIILACIGNLERFPNLKKLKAYSGLIPAVNQSGEHSVKGLKITKQGPNQLKRALYLAADNARHWDVEMAQIYFRAMMTKGQCHTQAVCAVATRLLGRIYAILKAGRPYINRDLSSKHVTRAQANRYIDQHLRVPEHVRSRKRTSKQAKMERLHPSTKEAV